MTYTRGPPVGEALDAAAVRHFYVNTHANSRDNSEVTGARRVREELREAVPPIPVVRDDVTNCFTLDRFRFNYSVFLRSLLTLGVTAKWSPTHITIV